MGLTKPIEQVFIRFIRCIYASEMHYLRRKLCGNFIMMKHSMIEI